jgi:dephospho-CoA kinase
VTTIFGLTGGIASGKSTVAGFFAARGLPIIDADLLAREAVLPGTPTLARIAARFGAEMLDGNGGLERARLAERVFHDEAARTALNQLVHPEVARLFQERRRALEASGEPLACYDVPLLFERGLQTGLRPVVVVSVSREIQIERAIARGLSPEQAEARVAAQMPLEEKAARADFVIDNGGSRDETKSRADAVLVAVCERTSVDASRYGL